MIKAIIVEDDPKHSNTLLESLKDTPTEVEVLAVVRNVADAEKAIRKQLPGLVFLDIDLERGDNGFDLLHRFDKPEFAVIFTTQHNNTDNAISAIRACALDFLPKPVLQPELENALARYSSSENIRQVQTLKENIGSDNNEWVKSIWISGTEGKTKIETDNILYCQSRNTSTRFYLQHPVDNKEMYLSSQPIKHWEHSLLHSNIMRVHNEYLVSLVHVEKYHSKLSGSVLVKLASGIEIPVSKNRKNEVKDRLKMIRLK